MRILLDECVNQRLRNYLPGHDCESAEYWDQTLTLLPFENGEVPPAKKEEVREDEEELGLEELDGNLRWPSKKRRR
jgi:hypothetical protein